LSWEEPARGVERHETPWVLWNFIDSVTQEFLMRTFALSAFSALALSLVSPLAPASFAAKFKTVEYGKGAEKFEGFVATPSKAFKGTLPAILVVHNWLGVTEETRTQAGRLADLGYVVFAADIYGKGVRPAGPQEAGALAGKYKGDRSLFRERLTLAYEEMLKVAAVNRQATFAAGYCFGGTGVLELARTGAPLKGVVSFHGGLDSPTPADGANVKAAVLALHGADDPYVPVAELAAFEKEMASNKVDWQLVKFGNTVHSFTEKAAGDDNSKGAAYNAVSDARSFAMTREFLARLLAAK
jgi:dienelactone hydrolase